MNKSLERLSSGYRINRAADDAAGLQISENLRRQIRGVNQAISNAQDGNNVLSILEGSVRTFIEGFQRIRELTLQAANDTNSQTQRDTIAQEINQRILELFRIADSVEFNGIKLLPGSYTDFRIQVGPGGDLNLDTIDMTSITDIPNVSIESASVSFPDSDAARNYLPQVDNALDRMSEHLALIGASQNQLDSAIRNLGIARENYEAAESRIRNVDIARETANLIRSQILQQVFSIHSGTGQPDTRFGFNPAQQIKGIRRSQVTPSYLQ